MTFNRLLHHFPDWYRPVIRKAHLAEIALSSMATYGVGLKLTREQIMLNRAFQACAGGYLYKAFEMFHWTPESELKSMIQNDSIYFGVFPNGQVF